MVDVRINGSSILNSSGIANIDYASTSSYGVIKIDSNQTDLLNTSNGIISLGVATNSTDIANKGNKLLVASQIDNIVKEGLVNSSLTLNSTEQSLARNFIGAGTTKAEKINYLTTAPNASNTDGLIFVVLSEDPVTKYDGYLYFII